MRFPFMRRRKKSPATNTNLRVETTYHFWSPVDTNTYLMKWDGDLFKTQQGAMERAMLEGYEVYILGTCTSDGRILSSSVCQHLQEEDDYDDNMFCDSCGVESSVLNRCGGLLTEMSLCPTCYDGYKGYGF